MTKRLPIVLISREPLVLLTVAAPHLATLLQYFKSRSLPPVRIFLMIWWALHEDISYVLRSIRTFEREIKDSRVTVLANDLDELKLLQTMGLRSILCNHNAFVDERLFGVRRMSRKYEAIYNAAIRPYKRHHLAAQVQRLALLGYLRNSEERTGEDVEYEKLVYFRLSHATWINRTGASEFQWMPTNQVADCLSMAMVGLSLSAIEGANYAAVEYLLSGLPIVSTPSTGGRAILYSPENHVLVEANPIAVAAGVSKAIAMRTDPLAIRMSVIELLALHRDNFVAELSLLSIPLASCFVENSWFRNRMYEWSTLHFLDDY